MVLDLYVAEKLEHLQRPSETIVLSHRLAWEREQTRARRARLSRLVYRLGGRLAAPGLWLQRRSLVRPEPPAPVHRRSLRSASRSRHRGSVSLSGAHVFRHRRASKVCSG